MKDLMIDVEGRVREILAEQAGVPVEEIRSDTVPQDLGIDSMGLVEVIFAIEESFDIQVPFNANAPDAAEFDISSVGAITTAVERLVSEQS
jgi:acyl carrier protein